MKITKKSLLELSSRFFSLTSGAVAIAALFTNHTFGTDHSAYHGGSIPCVFLIFSPYSIILFRQIPFTAIVLIAVRVFG
ncbi:MAG: hypothetical protein IJ269_04215 [Bacteroidales bacterium]|nr:hypothetical protein [Bacteroidales bacterium]